MTTATRSKGNPALLNAMTETGALLKEMFKLLLKIVLVFVVVLLTIFVGVLIHMGDSQNDGTQAESAPAPAVQTVEVAAAGTSL